MWQRTFCDIAFGALRGRAARTDKKEKGRNKSGLSGDQLCVSFAQAQPQEGQTCQNKQQ